MTGRTILVVLASGYDEFRRWCLDSGLRPDDPEVLFADRFHKLRGTSRVKVIRCRRWHEHPESHEMDAWLRAQGERHRTPPADQQAQIQVQPDPPHVADQIRDIRRYGAPPRRNSS